MSRIDERISRSKFDREIARLANQQATLQSRGVFVVGVPIFPYVDVVFVPRRSLQFVFQVQSVGLIALPQGVSKKVEQPFTGRAFKGRFDLSDYDIRAPGLALLDPWTDQPLPVEKMIPASEFEHERRAHLVLINQHPNTGRPFLCLRGTREYHEHPQHAGDQWMLYRNEKSLFDTIMSVWRVTIDLVYPTLQVVANGLQLSWVTDEKA